MHKQSFLYTISTSIKYASHIDTTVHIEDSNLADIL